MQHKILGIISDNYFFINQQGMYILGIWAVVNMVLGLFYFRTAGVWKYFFLMGFYWNIVNLFLAIYTLYDISLMRQNVTSTGLNALNIINNHHFIQKILLVNVGLDIAYLVSGFLLKEKAKNNLNGNNLNGNSPNSSRMQGFGNSLLVQGGFLLIFDIMMVILHQIHNAKWLEKYFTEISSKI